MTEYTPIPPETAADASASREITFTPVPVRPSHDGWTAEKQFAFVQKLADTGSITAACKYVAMSRESVRKLRSGQAVSNEGDKVEEVEALRGGPGAFLPLCRRM